MAVVRLGLGSNKGNTSRARRSRPIRRFRLPARGAAPQRRAVEPNGAGLSRRTSPSGSSFRPPALPTPGQALMEPPTTPCAKALKAARLFQKTEKPTTIDRKSLVSKRQMSWWDSAAVQIAGGASSPERGMRVLVRGRNHARADMKDVDKWRDAACDAFLEPGAAKTPRMPHLELPETVPVCRSPCHFSRKYGKVSPWSGRSPRGAVRLEPLLKPDAVPRCGTILADGAPLSARERANAEARAACWRAARSQLVQGLAAHWRDAAAAV